MDETNMRKWILGSAIVLNGIVKKALTPEHFGSLKKTLDQDIEAIWNANSSAGLIPLLSLNMVNLIYNFLVLPNEFPECSCKSGNGAWGTVETLINQHATVDEGSFGKTGAIRRLRNAVAHGHVDISNPFVFEDWKPGSKSDKKDDYVKFRINPENLNTIITCAVNEVVIPFLRTSREHPA